MSIAIINISYDISVKALSFFLVFASVIGFHRYATIFKTILSEITQLHNKKNSFSKKNNFLYPFVKSLVILLFLFEVLYPNIQNTLVKPNKKTSHLIGGYSVIKSLKNNKENIKPEIKRIFIHKNSYLIFQYLDDQMVDYKLHLTNEKNQFIITDYHLNKTIINYNYKEGILELNFNKNNNEHQLTAKTIILDSLPLLKRKFHWFIDGIQ